MGHFVNIDRQAGHLLKREQSLLPVHASLTFSDQKCLANLQMPEVRDVCSLLGNSEQNLAAQFRMRFLDDSRNCHRSVEHECCHLMPSAPPFIAHGANFLLSEAHPARGQFLAQGRELFNRGPGLRYVMPQAWHQTRHGPAVSSDDNHFALFDAVQQFGEPGLRLVRVNDDRRQGGNLIHAPQITPLAG